MRYNEMAKAIAFSYKANCHELELLTVDRDVVPEVRGFVKGRVSKPVEAEFFRKLADKRYAYLVQAVQAVDLAISKVREFPDGDKTIKMFEMVYRDGTHRLYGAAMCLGVSERTIIRYNTYFIRLIAVNMGFISTTVRRGVLEGI